MSVLSKLLERIREYQSYCPYCGQEYVCNSECVLDCIWFKRVEPKATQLPDVDPDCQCVGLHLPECPWSNL